MASAKTSIRLPFQMDSQPVNGVYLVRCEALDLVCQGPTPEAAQAQMQEEAALFLGTAKELGTLAAWTGKIAGLPASDSAVTINLNALP